MSGLWHGANWTFIAWGTLHGLYLLIEVATRVPRTWLVQQLRLATRPLLYRTAKTLFVFALMMAGWVFFRAESIGDAIDILVRSWDLRGFHLGTLWSIGLPRFEMVIAFVSIAVLFLVDGVLEFRPARIAQVWEQKAVRWTLYLACMFSVVFFGAFGRAEFIYFQF